MGHGGTWWGLIQSTAAVFCHCWPVCARGALRGSCCPNLLTKLRVHSLHQEFSSFAGKSPKQSNPMQKVQPMACSPVLFMSIVITHLWVKVGDILTPDIPFCLFPSILPLALSVASCTA